MQQNQHYAYRISKTLLVNRNQVIIIAQNPTKGTFTIDLQVEEHKCNSTNTITGYYWQNHIDATGQYECRYTESICKYSCIISQWGLPDKDHNRKQNLSFKNNVRKINGNNGCSYNSIIKTGGIYIAGFCLC